MATLLWATDVHLDHLPHPAAALEFGRALRRENPSAEALLVSGDIGEARSIERILNDLALGFRGQVAFVLGNHDYYGGSFSSVDEGVARLAQRQEQLCWLRHAPQIFSGLIFIGNSGWYDARNGDRRSDLKLTDFVRIEELFAAQDQNHEALLGACARRADAMAALLRQQLLALPMTGDAVVVTHVPPFQDAAWYNGRTSDNRWAPFFSSRASGNVLLEVACARPNLRLTVLCGHTHGQGVFQALDNLTVYTGRAQYGAPELAGILHIDDGKVRVKLT